MFKIILFTSVLITCISSSYTMNFEGNIELINKQFMKIDFEGANLQNVDFAGQNLSKVNFCNADISQTNLIGTILTNAKMNNNTKFSGAKGWSGTIRIEAGENKPTLYLTGMEIEITKEWLINQGVIFEN